MLIAFTHNLRLSDREEEAEFDHPETVAAITEGLRVAGHEVEPIEVSGPASRLVARLEALSPEMVFNTAEGSRGRFREGFYPALFDQLGIPFTGSDAYVCTATLDKQFTKLVLASHGIPTPRWRFVEEVHQLDDHDLRFPVILKPNFEGSSMGISADSVVEDDTSMRALCTRLLETYPSGVLVEEYIVGNDLVVPYLESASPNTGGVLEPALYEMRPDAAAGRKYRVFDYELKTRGFDAMVVHMPANISEECRSRAIALSQKIFRILGVRDVGRIDFRLDDQGELYFLEVNALPSLEAGASLYRAGALLGLSESQVLDAVTDSACRRYGIAMTRRRGRRRQPLHVALLHSATSTVHNGADNHQALREAIESHGHHVFDLEATPELPSLLPSSGVDLVFNAARSATSRNSNAQIPALLDLLEIPYVGSDAAAMIFAADKPLAKRLVREAGCEAPLAGAVGRTKVHLPRDMTYPVVVKPASSRDHHLEPIAVGDADALAAALTQLRGEQHRSLVVEQYVAGREFVLCLLGERRPRTLPAMEVIFPEGSTLPVLGAEGARPGVSYRFDTVSSVLQRSLSRAARSVFAALGCRDMARMVFRVSDDGRVHFISCQPVPTLTPDTSDVMRIAAAAGMDTRTTLGELLAPAMRRLREQRKHQRLAHS